MAKATRQEAQAVAAAPKTIQEQFDALLDRHIKVYTGEGKAYVTILKYVGADHIITKEDTRYPFDKVTPAE